MTENSLTITKATTADATVLSELGIITFTEAFAAANRQEDMDKYLAEAMSADKIAEELADAHNLFLIAWHNGEPAGYAKLGFARKPEADGFVSPVELERIYVLRKYYGNKIGAALMNMCITYAINHHYKTMWLGVWEHNHRAISFYKQWRFEFYGTHPFVLGDDLQTDELMKKVL
jgi:ribosomal protein S18 acetylase RimI-like enzyme